MLDVTGLSCRAICVVIYQIWSSFLIIFDCEVDNSIFLFFLFGMFAKSCLDFEEKWAAQTWENVSFFSSADHGSRNVLIKSWLVFLDYNRYVIWTSAFQINFTLSPVLPRASMSPATLVKTSVPYAQSLTYNPFCSCLSLNLVSLALEVNVAGGELVGKSTTSY